MKFDEIRKNIIETYLSKWVTPAWDSDGWTIEKDGSVDIQGSLIIREYSGSTLPFKIKNVDGNLIIISDTLTSLEGCPKKVSGSFDITSNSLKNLKGSPKIVLGDYFIRCNSLESIEGISTEIDGNLWYNSNGKDITTEMLVEQNCKLKGKILISNNWYSSSGSSGTSGPTGYNGTISPQGIHKPSQQKVYIVPKSNVSEEPVFRETDTGKMIVSLLNFKKKITKILNFIWSKK